MTDRTHRRAPRVLFTGGGTGGHIMPGLATAEALRHLRPDARILFLTTRRRTEPLSGGALAAYARAEAVPTPLHGPGRLLQLPWRTAAAAGRAHDVLRAWRPDVVVGLGTPHCAVPVLVARAMGVPTAVFEANAVPGRVVRVLAPVVDVVFAHWAAPERALTARRVAVTGLPVRPSLLGRSTKEARRAFGLRAGVPTALVMGGSQGALALNDALYGALERIRAAGLRLQVVHLTGRAHLAEAQRRQFGPHCDYRPIGFQRDMGAAYAAADFAVARSGSTVAELTAVGLPALLVPYPYHADGHQVANASEAEAAGAARCLLQTDLTAGRLADEMARLAFDHPYRSAMAAAARRIGRPKAAEAVARALLSAARRRTAPRAPSVSFVSATRTHPRAA